MKLSIKILIILSAFFLCTESKAQESAELGQVIAQKIKSNVLQGKALAEAILQYETMLEQSETLKAMKDVYDKVSEGVKKYTPVKNSVVYMYKTIDLYKVIIVELRNLKDEEGNAVLSADEINSLDNIMLAIIQDNAKNVKDLKQIMTNDKLKMNDGERMEIAKKIEKRTANNYYNMYEFTTLLTY